MVDPLLTRSLAQAGSGRHIVVFDLETTGLIKPGLPIPRAWQLAAVKLKFDPSTTEITELLASTAILNVGTPLPEIVAQICQVDANLPLLRGWDPVVILARFSKFLDGAVLAGQNILNFDVPILAEEYRRVGLPIPVQLTDPGWCIDTTLMARTLFRGGGNVPSENGRPSNKLNVLGRWYGCDFDETKLHDAMNDVRLTAQVLAALLGDVSKSLATAA